MSTRCIICDSVGEWENVDKYRIKEEGMCICKKCGFITYPEKLLEPEEMKAHLRADARPLPNVKNIYTGQNKLHYHSAFLSGLFNTWMKEKREGLVFCDVGAAFGMFLNWVRQTFKGKCELYGTELALSYRRNAWHEYGIYLSEDFNDEVKYDFISAYKVLEHIPDADKELRRYTQCLKDGGYLYVSVPTWFGVLSNFGVQGWDLEYYYHPDHINVFTVKHFQTILNKCGLKVIKEDHVMYGDTYLCQRDDSLMKEVPVYGDPTTIIEHMIKIKEANICFEDGKFDKAIELWPNFPFAHLGNYESNRATIHKNGWPYIEKEILQKAISLCPMSAEIMFLCLNLAMRYDQWEIALKYAQKSVDMKPNNTEAILNLAQCFRQMAKRSSNPKERVRLIKEARAAVRYLRDTCFQVKPDAITWIMNDNSHLPMKGEPGYEEEPHEKTLAK